MAFLSYSQDLQTRGAKQASSLSHIAVQREVVLTSVHLPERKRDWRDHLCRVWHHLPTWPRGLHCRPVLPEVPIHSFPSYMLTTGLFIIYLSIIHLSSTYIFLFIHMSTFKYLRNWLSFEKVIHLHCCREFWEESKNIWTKKIERERKERPPHRGQKVACWNQILLKMCSLKFEEAFLLLSKYDLIDWGSPFFETVTMSCNSNFFCVI